MLRIAAIDVGSNAIRMSIAEVDASWKIKVIETIRVPVRLGQDVFTGGTLQESTMRHTVAAFQRFQLLARNFDVDHVRAVATSAMRDSGNSQSLLDRIFQDIGIKIEIIDGDEEARLIHLAVAHNLEIKNKLSLLMDIGGGSVEITVANGDNIIFTSSYDIGSVRLLKNLEKQDNARQSFSQLVHEFAEPAMHLIEQEIGTQNIEVCVGTGGAVEEIGRLRLKLYRGETDRLIYLGELERLIEHLGHTSIEDRIGELGLRPDRADVIQAAAIIMHLIASLAHVNKVSIPHVGLKEGILLDLAQQLSRAPRPERRLQIMESAMHLGQKYQFDENHARLTSKLAEQLFLQSTSLHNLDKNYLLLLEVGALLHDIGQFIDKNDHEKHGYYVLKANHLIGLTEREQNIIANLVRYHRSRTPSVGEESLKSFEPKDRQSVLKLTALLRLADSLDVSHASRIDNVVFVRDEYAWRLILPDDLMLEKWAIDKHKEYFFNVFGVNLIIE